MNTAKNTQKPTRNQLTIGIDLGDKSHETCTLNTEGEIIERSSVLNNQPELLRFSRENKGATLIMEAGYHSPLSCSHCGKIPMRTTCISLINLKHPLKWPLKLNTFV